MRLCAIVCHVSTLCKQTHPNSCLLNHLKCWGDQHVSQFTMAHSGGIITILYRAVVLLHSDCLYYGPRLSNRWLPAATWTELLVKSGHIDPTIVTIDARKFNSVMSKSILFGELMTLFDSANQSGMFRVCYQKQFFYYFTEKKRQANNPFPLDKTWKEWAEQAAVNALSIPLTRGWQPSFFQKPRCCGKW